MITEPVPDLRPLPEDNREGPAISGGWRYCPDSPLLTPMDDQFAARNLKPTMPRLSRERRFAPAELQSFERSLGVSASPTAMR
jgi:hypothetical protein